MFKLMWTPPKTLEDVQARVQTAINLEFSTLPPYLYTLLSIPPGENLEARSRIYTVTMQEMIHMCLACNILNAIGGRPAIVAPKYPGPLPGDLAHGVHIHLYPFSEEAIAQGMTIEQPEDPVAPSNLLRSLEDAGAQPVTIGQYYALLDDALSNLPASDWQTDRNQFDDSQFMQGNLFKVNSYADAHQAIFEIVSEGEGTPVTAGDNGSPLDWQNELAHYYRFWEVKQNLVLTKADTPSGYQWGPQTLGVDWSAVYPAIKDPEQHDFSSEPQAAQDAQQKCNDAYSAMIAALELAFNGQQDQLGIAVRAMFDLRMAARVAFTTPLNCGKVAGPAFLDNAPGWVASNAVSAEGEVA